MCATEKGASLFITAVHKQKHTCKYNIHSHTHSHLILKAFAQDFPGGPVVKNPPANAGATGLIPGLGRSGPLSPQLQKSRALKPVLRDRRGHCSEKPVHHS